MIVKAVHLEIASDLSDKKFYTKRGLLKFILTNNRKQFVLSLKFLKSLFKKNYEAILCEKSFVSQFLENGIKWDFIVVKAPWMERFYEKLVSLVKHHLKRSLQYVLIKKNVFETLFIKVEFILNNKLITFISYNELKYSLKTIDFLISRIRNLIFIFKNLHYFKIFWILIFSSNLQKSGLVSCIIKTNHSSLRLCNHFHLLRKDSHLKNVKKTRNKSF